MQTIRSSQLQKNLGDVLDAADVEAVLVTNSEQPRVVVMSADEFIRLKMAAGEPVPAELITSTPILHQAPLDPLGYDTRELDYACQMARDAQSVVGGDLIAQEIQSAFERWGMRR